MKREVAQVSTIPRTILQGFWNVPNRVVEDWRRFYIVSLKKPGPRDCGSYQNSPASNMKLFPKSD